jgi:predicted CoA-binding protein
MPMPLAPRAVAELSVVKRHPALQVTPVKDISKEEPMQDLIQEFMSQKKFAIVGATADTRKYGNEIFKNLKSRGYEVYPVNPRLEELEGTRCYPSLSDIPIKVDVVDFVVPPPVTEEILKECKKLGLDRIWLQPGSESEEAISFCHENNLKVVHDVCVMLS